MTPRARLSTYARVLSALAAVVALGMGALWGWVG